MRRSRRLSRTTSGRLLPDTNVLVYETVEDSPHHEEAARLLDEAGELVLPAIVLHEYMWVMTRGIGVDPVFVAQKLREYLEDPRVLYVAEPPTALYRALELLAEHEANPRELNDYIILATALEYNATLATFDNGLRKLAARLGVETLP